MILHLFILVVGFGILIKGADLLVSGASSIAYHAKISKKIIGLTIVAFGTSAPELAISINAITNNSTDIVIGNVIGSNILNILLILGIAAIICPMKIKNNVIKKEIPILMLISVLMIVFFLDISLNKHSINQLSVTDAISLLLFFTIFLEYLFVTLKKEKKIIEVKEKPKYTLIKSILFFALGLIMLIFGSEFVVNSASNIARMFNVSERVISLTILAFGASLPELITVIVASTKKESDITLGNIIGSNIFNICVVLAIPVILFGNINVSGFTTLDLAMLVGSTLILFVVSLTNAKITRREGILLVLTFVIYFISVLL